jgi:hypothetical protein
LARKGGDTEHSGNIELQRISDRNVGCWKLWHRISVTSVISLPEKLVNMGEVRDGVLMALQKWERFLKLQKWWEPRENSSDRSVGTVEDFTVSSNWN